MKTWHKWALAGAAIVGIAAAPSYTALIFHNSTSGTITLQPPSGALGTRTITVPARTATMALTTGTPATNDCAKFDASGNLVTAGAACGSGGGTLTVTDGTHSVASTTTLTVGSNFVVGGSAGSATLDATTANTTHITSATIANIGGQDNYNGSSLTITIPGTGTLGAGQTALVINRNASAATISTSQTLNGIATTSTLRQYGWFGCTGNGSSADCFGFPGFGTISSGALMKYAGADGAATAGDLSGDATTSGTLAVTVTKTNGVAFGTAATVNTGTSGATIPLLNGTNTWSGTQTFGTTVSTVSTQSGTSYTLAATDCGTTINFTSGSAITLTTLNSLPVGCYINVLQSGAGQITVANGSGATSHSAHSYTKSFGQYSLLGLYVDANSGGAAADFIIYGDGA